MEYDHIICIITYLRTYQNKRMAFLREWDILKKLMITTGKI